ncbi:radical SAM protein [Candidatus Omnitrophota bacterium]
MNYYSQIQWVDEYIRNVASFIYVRETDNLLIKIPNEAYKLNPQGVALLKHLLKGESIYTIINRYAEREQVAYDIHNFFCDLRAVLKGCYHEQDERRAVEKVPFALPFNTLPVLSEIALTYRCNLACRFCYAACGCKKVDDSPELSSESFKKILAIIKHEAEVPSVSFTGGEPTLRDDLFELIEHAKSLRMWTNLITNATLITKDFAAKLKHAGLDSAQVSLEAAEATVHDSIVKSPGAFSLTLQGLKHLQEAGIRVHTNSTISALNKNHLLKIVELVKKRGLSKFSMNMLMPEGAAVENLKEVLVTYTEIGGIILQVAKHAKQLGLEFMWYSPTPMCIFNPIVHGLGNKGCAACDGLLSISPSGDILPCSSFPQPMGNMLKIKGRFREMWRSPDFEFFQKKRFAHDICQACEDLAVCNGGCPLYWKQVGFKEILHNCKEALV